MKSHGIKADFHYQPLLSSKGGQKYGRKSRSMEVYAKTAENLVSLPLFYDLSDTGIEQVIEYSKRFMKEVSKSSLMGLGRTP